jgi:chorismate mutase/prephenate dehydrogenase
LKSPLLNAIEQAVRQGRKVASLHPMFAPGAVLLSGRVLLVCDCGHAAATREARALFEDTALRLVTVPVAEHDRLMGVVLGLSHALNIAFASALGRIGFSYVELDRTSSTTFGRQIRTTAEVVAENPRLYYEIQHFNRHTGEMLEALQEALGRVRDAAGDATPERFLEVMQEGHHFFADRPVESGSRVVG